MYRPGDFYRFCDRCGFRYLASETFRTWDGLYVCEADFETRHPQDFVRGRRDRQNVPNPRPEPADVYIGPGLTLETESGMQLVTEGGALIGIDGT